MRKATAMKLFFCFTHYHTLIAMIKAIENCEHPDILLANDIPGFDSLYANLLDSGVFNNIYVYDAKTFTHCFVFRSKIDRAIRSRRIVRKILPQTIPLNLSELKKYSEIYISNDMTGPAKYLILNKVPYHLIEDGLDYFSYFDRYYSIPKGAFTKNGMRKKIKEILGVGFLCWGQAECCIDIEVNSIDNLKIPTDKVIVVPRKKMFDSLSDQQKKLIFATYAKGKATAEVKSGKSMILLTQPLYADKFVQTEEDQRVVFESVIKEYIAKGYAVAIKPHPRDLMNYIPLVEKYNCVFIDKDIPSEILNFDSDSHFDTAVSITSTAINFLENAKEKRFMGREYISQCLKED